MWNEQAYCHEFSYKCIEELSKPNLTTKICKQYLNCEIRAGGDQLSPPPTKSRWIYIEEKKLPSDDVVKITATKLCYKL